MLSKIKVFILHSSGDQTLHNLAIKTAQETNGTIVNVANTDYENEIHFPNEGFTKNWYRIIEEYVFQNLNLDFEYIGLFNDDIDISSDVVARVIQFLDEHPRTAMASASFNTDLPFAIPDHIRRVGYSIRPVVEFTAPIFRVSALKEIGNFDTRFELGWGIDYDWCFRARRKGYSIAMVEDVSFYHFQHSSIDRTDEGRQNYFLRAREQMNTGLTEKYGSNWYEKIRTTVALTMVVRNEIHTLPTMLNYHKGLCDEVVIGVEPSHDGTLEYTKQNADYVFELPDVGYCEAHRGFISGFCFSDVQLCLDADEFLDPNFIFDFSFLILEINKNKKGIRLMRRHYIDDHFKFEGDIQHRLYHRDGVKFVDQLHTEPLPTYTPVPLWSAKIAGIHHRKTLIEQYDDEYRYQTILKADEKYTRHSWKQRLWEISSVYTNTPIPEQFKQSE